MKKLKELYKFLFVTETDKGTHFFFGGWIAAFLMFTIYRVPILYTDISILWSKALSFGLSLLCLFVIAILKEEYDKHYKEQGFFNWQDVKWGMIGGVLFNLILIGIM